MGVSDNIKVTDYGPQLPDRHTRLRTVTLLNLLEQGQRHLYSQYQRPTCSECKEQVLSTTTGTLSWETPTRSGLSYSTSLNVTEPSLVSVDLCSNGSRTIG